MNKKISCFLLAFLVATVLAACGGKPAAPSVAPSPSATPNASVEASIEASVAPSTAPSVVPSTEPSAEASQTPSVEVSVAPSIAPSVLPSVAPSLPEDEPKAEYTVEHYLQTLDGSYELEDSKTLLGVVGDYVKAEINSYEHFECVDEEIWGDVSEWGDTVLQVYYDRVYYTVTFNGNGATGVNGIETQQVRYGAAATPPSYQKPGYEFTGFDCDFSEITGSITVTAIWEMATYTVTYRSTVETVLPENPESYTVESAETLQNPADIPYYRFKGWYNGAMKVNSFSGLYGDLVLTAKWESAFEVNGAIICGFSDFGNSLNITDLDIPAEVFGEPIAEIGTGAFQENATLSSVRIAEGVQTIGENAFFNCSALKTLYLPSTVTDVRMGAFAITTIESVHLESLSSYMAARVYSSPFVGGANAYEKDVLIEKIVGFSANFAGCSSLKEVDASGLEWIEDDTVPTYAFYGCKNLEKVVLPETVEEVFSGAFAECTALKEINLDYVDFIRDSAFENCTSLTNFFLNSFEGFIGESAFKNCTSLTSLILESQTIEIGDYAFQNCGFTEISLGKGVTLTGSYAFEGCKNLTWLTLNGTKTKAGGANFAGCNAIKRLVLRNVEIIGQFSGFGKTIETIILNNGVRLKSNFPVIENEYATLYYEGTEAELKQIDLYQYSLSGIKQVYFYSETPPEEEGNWYYYDENGLPALWE